jgi:imidazolonepropionase-like amidohydrolase
MKKFILRFPFAIVAISLFGLSIFAQTRTDVYAITNANIVTVSGNPISGGTIIVRDGLIESVGTNIKVPADAKVFDATGLTVYPGLIDTYTDLGLQKATSQRPQQGGQGQNQEAGSNSNYPEGLQPEEMAFDKLKANETQFETQRNNGITTVLTVGTDGIFNGQSVIINLAGDSVSSMVLRPVFAQHITYTTLRGGQYPTSLMGTFSALRQMFLDAKRLQEWKRMYAEDPRGIKRPDADKSLEALFPVVNGQLPIAFNANTEREIIRTLDLAKEFNLKAIIVGGQESWKVSNRLKEQNVPVFLSLDFPKRTLSENKEADPENLEILRLRAEVPKNAARLKQAGVKFAFQSGAMKNIKDFLANANEATENGLSKNDAIRAMTLSAAELLGIDNQLGSIEKGKIANLIVVKGDIFDEKREFTHVFVDGKFFEQTPKPKKDEKKTGEVGTGKTAVVGGKWDVKIETPGQQIDATFDFQQQGSTLTGTLTTQFGTSQINDGKVSADGFSFSARVDAGGQEMEIFVSGKLSGSEIEGTITTPQGAVSFSGNKIP